MENGVAPRVIGEFITFSAEKSPNMVDVPIAGQSGKPGQKNTGSTRTGTATYYEGTDGSFWERMDEDRDNGIERPFTIVTSDRDDIAPAVGEAIREYSHCLLTNNQPAGVDPSGLKIATITFTYENKKLVQGYTPVQGVI